MGHIHRRAWPGKTQHAAVISAVKRDDAVAPGEGPCRRQREQVRLGTGIGKAHLFDTTEALHDQRCQPRFQLRVGAEVQPIRHRRRQRLDDRRVRVPIQRCGVFGEKVDITMPVQVIKKTARPARHHQRKRLIKQH